MTKSTAAATLILLIVGSTINAQQKVTSFSELRSRIAGITIGANTAAENVLVTGRAFNIFMQRKVSTYLTGSSEISLSKVYATYTSESDKLTFGFNFPRTRKKDDRLVSLINPLLETDIKNNFATLYKKGKWQSNIRLGFKYSYFPSYIFGIPTSTINFYGIEHPGNQKSRMVRKRSEAAQSIIEKIDKEEGNQKASASATLTASQAVLKKQYEAEKAKYNEAKLGLSADQTDKAKQRIQDIDVSISKLDFALQNIDSLDNKEPYAFDKKLEEYENELAKAEVDALYEEKAYTWSQTAWFSLWGFTPLTERINYIAENSTQSFAKQKFKPWEINFQFNYLREGRLGVGFLALGYKFFQNNSALADLMTSVDYNQYLQFPGIDTANAAILETNKAHIGKYVEFRTSNINVQIVLSLSDKKRKGGERFLTPGISFRYEKNIGDFSAVNWRFGLPLRFKGKEKEKTVNIEPQVRLNNTNNYANKPDYKVQPIFGVNIGLPFATLFKS